MKSVNQLENIVLMDAAAGELVTPAIFALMNQANKVLTNLYIAFVGPSPTAGSYEYTKDNKLVKTYSLSGDCLTTLKSTLL